MLPPTGITHPLRDGGQVVVVNEARERHRRRRRVRGREHEAHVLEPERELEARGLVRLGADDDVHVAREDRGPAEERLEDALEILRPDAVLARAPRGLAERLDRRRDREVAGELHHVGELRRLADDAEPAAAGNGGAGPPH